MAPTTFTTIVLMALGALLLTMASWAWFGDWQPEPRRARSVDDRVSAEVAALRAAIESYEREQRGG